MKAGEIDNSVIEAFTGLFKNLSTPNKLKLIANLTKSVTADLSRKKNSFHKAFGALDTNKSADEMIAEIRSSRLSTRQTESF